MPWTLAWSHSRTQHSGILLPSCSCARSWSHHCRSAPPASRWSLPRGNTHTGETSCSPLRNICLQRQMPKGKMVWSTSDFTHRVLHFGSVKKKKSSGLKWGMGSGMKSVMSSCVPSKEVHNLMKECSWTVYCESPEFVCRPKTTGLGVSLNGYVGFDV